MPGPTPGFHRLFEPAINGQKAGDAKSVFNIDLGSDGGSTNSSWKTAC
jgi:hypothetical protein